MSPQPCLCDMSCMVNGGPMGCEKNKTYVIASPHWWRGFVTGAAVVAVVSVLLWAVLP